MSKSRLIKLLILPAIILVLLLAPVVLLSTQSGSQWLLRQVPGLTVHKFTGALLGQWSVEQLQWQDEQTQIQLEELSMAIDPRCLWRAELCVQELSARQLSIQVLENDEENTDSESFELTDLQLPLTISVAQFSLQQLLFNDELILQGIKTQAQWVDNQLQIQQLSLAYQENTLELQGSLTAKQDWPLELTIQAQGILPELGEQQLSLDISGTLEQLLLKGELTGVLQGSVTAELQPLTANFPAKLNLELTRLQLAAVLPELLVVQQLSVSAQGDLAAGYQWQQSARLLANQQPIELVGEGVLDQHSVSIKQLKLIESDTRYAQLTGQLDWQHELSAQAQVYLQQLNWHQLLGVEDVGIELNLAQIELSYQKQRYQAELASELLGPAGEFEVNAQLRGDQQQLDISKLQVIAGPGQVQGDAQLDFTQGVRWRSELHVNELNPAYWVADLPGNLAGDITTSGQFAEQLSAEAQIHLAGQLRGEQASVQGNLSGAGQHWQLTELLVQLGDNQLSGHLQVDEQLAGKLQLDVPRLTQILSGSAGRVYGQVDISGRLEQPAGALSLKAEGLAYQGYRVKQLDVQARLESSGQADIKLNATKLASAEQFFGDLKLHGNGDMHTQELNLQLEGPARAQASIQGELDVQTLHWRGSLRQLIVDVEQQHWQLTEPMHIDYQHEQRLQLGAHCFKGGQASLCAQQQQLLPRLAIDYQLKNFPLASLRPWLPKDLQLDALLNGRIQVQEQPHGLQGHVQLDAGKGSVHYVEQEQRHDFAWQVLQLNSVLNPQEITLQLELLGAQTGHLLLDLAMDPQQADKPLKGKFKLERLELAPLKAFVPEIEKIQGLVQGQGTIGGTLLKPSIDGQINLTDGLLAGDRLPLSLEQLWLQVQINGSLAKVEGGWRSGADGQAHVNGRVDWQNAMLVDIDLNGTQLPVQVAPYADLIVEPDLQLSLDERRLLLSGSISVPKGYITVPELPEQAVRVSADAYVLGREQQQPGLPLAMNIEIKVGQERLHFSGFGLTADVQGQIKVVDNLSARGVLELKNGRYRAYGQRLQLRRARLVFSGPISQPYIDIEAVRVTGDVTAGLRLSGLADQPQTEIFSQPPMSQEQALSWLLLGRPLTGGNSDDSNMMSQAALALGMLGTAPIVNRMADTFGIKEFELDTEGSGMSSSVMASGRITDKLVLSYGVGVFQPSSIIALRYELTKRLYLEAASSLASSLDLFYRRSF